MEYELINSLSHCIDNVYRYNSEDGARKTIAKMNGENCMEITYMTIINIARESDLHMQMSALKKESNDMISSRLRTIKSEFKKASGRALKTKKCGTVDNVETLTVSAYSPMKTLKFSYTNVYEVS